MVSATQNKTARSSLPGMSMASAQDMKNFRRDFSAIVNDMPQHRIYNTKTKSKNPQHASVWVAPQPVFVLAALLLLSSFAFAEQTTGSSGIAPEKFTGTLEVVKTAPASAKVTDELTISIAITNKGSAPVGALIVESLGNVQPIFPIPAETDVPEGMLAAEPPKLTWSLSLAAGATETVSYKVKPKTVGHLSFGPTAVFVPGAKFYSNPAYVMVECTGGTVCDESLGETPTTCPEKCGKQNPEEDSPAPPELAAVPTPAYSAPSDPKSAPPSSDAAKAAYAEKRSTQDRAYLIGGAVLIALLAGAYFLFLRKKK